MYQMYFWHLSSLTLMKEQKALKCPGQFLLKSYQIAPNYSKLHKIIPKYIDETTERFEMPKPVVP